MNYADIKQYDVANGPGVRVSLFVSGCTHCCKGCFNEEAWDFNYGNPFTKEQSDLILKYLAPDYVAGLSVLGGEPLEPQNFGEVTKLLRQVKETYPDKNIWLYTGYLFDQIVKNKDYDELLSFLDYLVDGEFEEENKKLTLAFRGSSNQRIIDVKKSLSQNEIVLWRKPGE